MGACWAVSVYISGHISRNVHSTNRMNVTKKPFFIIQSNRLLSF